MSNGPSIGIGHVALSVGDVETSARFYANLGLRPCYEDGSMAILELRGATHLLLFSKETAPAVRAPDRVDLMIAGRTRDELETYRAGVIASGLDASAIPDEATYGHYMFRLHDPDGHEVVVATSHCAVVDA